MKEITTKISTQRLSFTWKPNLTKKSLHHLEVDETEFNRINANGIVTIVTKDDVDYTLGDFVQILRKDLKDGASFTIVKIDTGLKGLKKGYFLMTLSRLQYSKLPYEPLEE